MAEYVGASTRGTTSTRFMIFDHGGQVVGVDQKEHEQIFPGRLVERTSPRSGPSQEVIPGALAKASLSAGDIAAIGIMNQRETTVVWTAPRDRRSTTRSCGRTHAPTRSATVPHRRRRPGPLPREDGAPDRHVFLRPEGPMILENVEGARARADAGELAFGNIPGASGILTGGVDGSQHVTDVTNARAAPC